LNEAVDGHFRGLNDRRREMKKIIKFILLILTSCVLLVGCAGKSKFIYEYPEAKPNDSSKIVLGYSPLRDERVDQSIDEAFENKRPVGDINTVIEKELMSTGLFSNVVLIPSDRLHDGTYLKENRINHLLTGQLKEFRWEVPGYKEKTDAIYIMGFLFGGIGAVLYGCTPTDVNGMSTLKITVVDLDTNRPVIDKEYRGQWTERKTLLACDSGTAKATVGGNSLKNLMDQFKKDLGEMLPREK
jgi:hypothetical protein